MGSDGEGLNSCFVRCPFGIVKNLSSSKFVWIDRAAESRSICSRSAGGDLRLKQHRCGLIRTEKIFDLYGVEVRRYCEAGARQEHFVRPIKICQQTHEKLSFFAWCPSN